MFRHEIPSPDTSAGDRFERELDLLIERSKQLREIVEVNAPYSATLTEIRA